MSRMLDLAERQCVALEDIAADALADAAAYRYMTILLMTWLATERTTTERLRAQIRALVGTDIDTESV